MELNKYIWLAVLPMIFTACQEDMLVKESSKQGITTLSATMGSDADSRAQIQLDTYPGQFMWNEGDAFTLFESLSDGGSMESKEFSIATDYSDESPSADANFSISQGNPLTSGSSFKAIYPSKENQEAGIFNGLDEVTNVNFISMQITQPQYNMSTLEGNTEPEKIENFWKTYFKNNLFMKAGGDVTSNTKVHFEHLCGLVRVSYTNNLSHSVTIREIRLNGQWQKQIYLNENTLERLSTQPELKPLSFSSESFSLHVDQYETRDFYFLFFPLETSDYEKFNGIEIDYIPDGNASEYVTCKTPSTYKGKGFVAPIFEAGKTYWFKITETGQSGEDGEGYSLAWTADLESGNEGGDNNTEDEYVVVNDYISIQEAIKNGKTKIRLKNDIQLYSPLNITVPTEIDLRGNTLSLAEGIDYSNKGGDAVLNFSGEESLQISNGTLKTNSSTTSLHRYYINNTTDNGSVHLMNVSLETGKAVDNAISAGASPCGIHGSTIKTNGFAVHWDCNNPNMTFETIFRESEIVGNICYVTSKSLEEIDKVSIYSCSIKGDLVTTLPNGVTRANVFYMDKESTAIDNNGEAWSEVGIIEEQ